MKPAKLVIVVIVWMASLVAVKVWAQGSTDRIINEALRQHHTEAVGPVLTGDDIGFQRLSGTPDSEGRIPIRLVMKVNGEWREATTSMFAIVR